MVAPIGPVPATNEQSYVKQNTAIQQLFSYAYRNGDIGFINVKNAPYNATGDGTTDDTTALQAAITAAQTAEVPLFIPVGRYKYTPPLVISANLSIQGAWGGAHWGQPVTSSDNMPAGTPPMAGAVLCPTSNGGNAITVTPAVSSDALNINLSDFSIEFQTAFTGTGHGINYSCAQDVQGLSGSIWSNISIYGHDGDHYAYNIDNMFYNTFTNCFSYGGGGWHPRGNSSGAVNFGNCVWINGNQEVVTGGTAHGIFLEATTGAALNLLTFIRPMVIVGTVPNISVADPPTIAQKRFTMSVGWVLSTIIVAPDFETSVSSPFEWDPHPSNSLIWNSGDWSRLSTEPTLLTTPATPFFSVLPSRNMFQINSTNNTAGSYTIGFSAPFPNGCANVMLTPSSATQVPYITAFTASSYSFTQADGGIIYALAYGF